MKYPMHAFKTVVVAQAAPGALVRFRDLWAVKVAPVDVDGQAIEQVLLLTGNNAGAVALAPKEPAVTVAAPFNWQIYVDGVAGQRNLEQLPAVRIGEQGPEIYGHAWGDTLEWQAVTKDGQHVDVGGGNHQYILDFSIWLVDDKGNQVGTEALCQFYSPAKAPR